MGTFDEFTQEFSSDPRKEKKCKNCRHFCPYIYEYDHDAPYDQLSSDYGECRRFPPKVMPPEDSGFPVVEDDMWCGEFDI